MNVVTLIGRLARDPDVRVVTGGTKVARFTLAVDKQLSKDKRSELRQQGQPTADFINVTVWGRQADVVEQYCRKGLLTGVQGRIQTGRYEDKTGQMRYTTEVVASSINILQWPDDRGQDGSSQGPWPEPSGDVNGFYPDSDDNIPF